MARTQAGDPEPRYCDFYGMMTYADFLRYVEAGNLEQYTISRRTD